MAGPRPGAGGAAHGTVPAAGHGRLGVTPANGASIVQRALQAEAPGQRCFAAMPGALPATLAPGNVAGTGVGWSPNPAPPWVAQQHPPLHWHWREACQGAGSPKPECLPSTVFPSSPHTHIPGPGKESAAPGAGRCCLSGGRAPGASDSRSRPAPLHASPSGNIPKSCRPFPKPGGLAARPLVLTPTAQAWGSPSPGWLGPKVR